MDIFVPTPHPVPPATDPPHPVHPATDPAPPGRPPLRDLLTLLLRSLKISPCLIFLAFTTGPFVCVLVHTTRRLQWRLAQPLPGTPLPAAEKFTNVGWSLLLMGTALAVCWLEIRIIRFALEEGRKGAGEEVVMVAEERVREVLGPEVRVVRRETGESWLWW